MVDIDRLLQLVQTDIEKIDATMAKDVKEMASGMDQRLFDILQYGLFGGGKRFRPLLAVISARLCGAPIADIFSLAIAFEYLHLATLFHDDVIDGAETRRGKASVCKAYGSTSAILAGDFLHARSMELVGQFGGIQALTIFCRATRAMVDGEFIQLRNCLKYDQSEAQYFKAIEGKTAVLISAATEIGALCGGADNTQQEALREYGRNLGFGFQIIDDLLDYQGDPGLTGKSIGNDLAEGKLTLPLILALECADQREQEEMLVLLADPDLRRQSFDVVYKFIGKNNGFLRAKEIATGCIDTALRHLDHFPDAARNDIQILQGLAQYALGREK